MYLFGKSLGAQASLPACFGQSVIARNLAGKDACAPRQFAKGAKRGKFQAFLPFLFPP
jgi:hypothetical protein